MLWSEKLARVKTPDEKSTITVIADTSGSISNYNLPVPPDSWASYPDADIAVYLIDMEPGGEFAIPVSSNDVNRNIYFFEGKQVRLNDEVLDMNFAAQLAPDVPVTLTNIGDVKSRLLVLQGKPIGEPVAQRGPFVMNTQQELIQAYSDFSSTQFGGWPWKSSGPVQPREKPRFAKFANSEEIYPTSNEGQV